MAGWERSPARADLVARLGDLVEDERFVRVEGLAGFFGRSAPAAPAWRVVLLTVVGVFLLTSSFHLLLQPLVADWPWPAQLIASAVVVVSGLRFVVMPALTRLCGAGCAGLPPLSPRGRRGCGAGRPGPTDVRSPRERSAGPVGRVDMSRDRVVDLSRAAAALAGWR